MKKYTFITLALVLMVQLSTGVAQAGKGGGSSSSGGSLGSYGYVDRVTYTLGGDTYTDTYGVTPGGNAWSNTTCDSCSRGGGGGGGSFGGGGTPPPPPPPPPLACKITVDKPAIGLGITKITISWLPSPTTNVSLKRVETIPAVAQTHNNSSQQASVILAGGGGGGSTAPKTTPPKVTTTTLIAPPSSASSFVDTVNETRPGTINYKITFNSTGVLALQHAKHTTQQASIILAGGGGGTPPPPPPPAYGCNVTVRIVSTLTECNDGIDNADPEDTLIDQQDPACHTDGNPKSVLTYDPLRTSETNPAVDVVARILAPLKTTAGSALSVTPSEQNIGTLPAGLNALVSGWRNLSPGDTPSCGPGGSLCFTANGQSYIRMSSLLGDYAPQQTITDTPFTFTPLVQGIYEVCAVADYSNVVAEGVAGEANNTACQPIQVLSSGTVISPPGVTTPLSFAVTPTRVKRGSTSNLVWDTGTRSQCTIVGTNGQTIYLAGTTGTGATTTSPIISETKYTLMCTDDNSSANITVRLLPQYREI